MPCKALWDQDVLRLGEALSAEYLQRLDDEGLLDLARARAHQGETGGAGREETDRHFASQFANSAARAVYICIDPLDALIDASELVRQFFTDGRVVLVEVPCGAGAGALGLISAIYEQRKAGLLPTLPLCVEVLGGDISHRGREHFERLMERLIPQWRTQGVDVTLRSQDWDARDIRSSSRFIDSAVGLSGSCDQVFLLVSNFSEALDDTEIGEHFQHFLSQFTGRIVEPNAVCWVEPTSNRAGKVLSMFGKAIARLASWLRISAKDLISGIRYRFLDPVTNSETHSGVRVLHAGRGEAP